MHVVPDGPGAAPDEAFAGEDVYDFLWRCPSDRERCHVPVVRAELFLPAPVDYFLIVAFRQNVDSYANAVERAGLSVADSSPCVAVGSSKSGIEFF